MSAFESGNTILSVKQNQRHIQLHSYSKYFPHKQNAGLLKFLLKSHNITQDRYLTVITNEGVTSHLWGIVPPILVKMAAIYHCQSRLP